MGVAENRASIYVSKAGLDSTTHKQNILITSILLHKRSAYLFLFILLKDNLREWEISMKVYSLF